MKKRIIIGTVISISMCFIFIIANLYIDYNLRKYSVYYAHNMEHKGGTRPELAMALENMNVIYKPDKKNIRYREDGGFTICNNYTDSEQAILSCDLGETELRFGYYDVTYKSYYFDDAFNLTLVYDSSVGHDKIDIKTVDQDALYKDIYNNFGFIVEANVNRKPRINLQKQFNKKYYKRFN
ncbi:hypothetical protein C5Q96_05925 [Mogibacterium diversum]|uniref:Uncharacterized protein n=1 Tax=Mogibacterium diversum TaxID=114527 RepID=A0A2S0L581_9FIRM|nr:hypothetical protein [Mogibacterium diversum]AVM48406.1 hypothetical protein C5Q96_05925 [Mogibacterium diversum]